MRRIYGVLYDVRRISIHGAPPVVLGGVTRMVRPWEAILSRAVPLKVISQNRRTGYGVHT